MRQSLQICGLVLFLLLALAVHAHAQEADDVVKVKSNLVNIDVNSRNACSLKGFWNVAALKESPQVRWGHSSAVRVRPWSGSLVTKLMR